MMYRRASISVVFLAVLGLLLAGCGGGSGDSDGGDVPFSTAEWSTDFEEHSVSLDEFTSGGPPKDGIPAIDRRKFVSTAEADGFLADREPVAVIELGGTTRAYPLQILTWHEIVNDEIGGRPVAVTCASRHRQGINRVGVEGPGSVAGALELRVV